MIYTGKGFSIVNEAYVFLEFSCFSYGPVFVGNLISGSSAFSKASLNIWKFSVHILLKPRLENCDHYFASMWDECNCAIVWTFIGIAFLWDWNENWYFPVLWPLLSVPNFLAYNLCLLLLLLSHFSHVWFCATPETAAHQAPPSLRFSRQEHWSGLPFSSPMHESKKWEWSRSVISDS